MDGSGRVYQGSAVGAKSQKRGATHQGNQQSSSVGVGPGQDGSFGAATVETNWAAAARRQAAVGLGGIVGREQQQEAEK